MISRRATYVLALFGTIVVISMLWRPAIVADKVGSWAAQGSVSYAKPYSVVDKTFLLLKTGTEVAYGRLPPHFNTTLKRFPHNAIYADTNDTIDGREVIDCLSFLPTECLNDYTMKGYRVRMQMREQNWHWGSNKVYVEGKDTGWDLDRFKNIPAYAEAWSRSQEYDWYVMIDADTYLAAYTLDRIVAGHNPDDILYFGKAVGWNPRFAHGGSGIVLSRGAMRAIFGTTEESISKALDIMTEVGPPECCGDSIVAKYVRRVLDAEPDEHLEDTEFARFQGARTMNTFVKFDEWCNSVGTFHGIQPWEIHQLSLWEEKHNSAKSSLLYKNFYEDFILPQVHNELPNWVFHDGPGEVDRRSWESFDREAQEKHACYEACLQDSDCMMWTFIGTERCTIFRNTVVMGEALNPYKGGDYHSDWTEVASGYMVDRIRERRQQQSCDGLRSEVAEPSKREGWFNVKLHQNHRDSTDLLEYKQVPLKITKPPKPPKNGPNGKPPHPPHPPHEKPEDGPHEKPGSPEHSEVDDDVVNKRKVGPAPTFQE